MKLIMNVNNATSDVNNGETRFLLNLDVSLRKEEYLEFVESQSNNRGMVVIEAEVEK